MYQLRARAREIGCEIQPNGVQENVMQAQPELQPVATMQEKPGDLTTAQERELLTAMASGDRRAAEELVDATYSRIYAALSRLSGGRRELAADLTQETYQKAWKSLAGFDQRARFSTWLYRIAYNTFLNHIRRPVRLMDDGSIEDRRDPALGPEALFQRRETDFRLRKAILELPESLRFTLTARFWAEMSVEDIARLEQVSGAAIRKRLKKAKKALRDLLEEKGK